MTLKEYYDSLPARVAPKTMFKEEIMSACGVKEVTVDNWMYGKSTPANAEHRRIISTATGIPESELFPKV